MKKLKLTALSLGAKDVLTRTQLKNILGGSGGSNGPGSGDDGDSGCSSFASCCVECDGKGVTVDCGLGVTCSTRGTLVKCGDGDWVDQCAA